MLNYKYEHNFTKYLSGETMQYVQVDKAPAAMSLKWCLKYIAELRTE